MRLDEQTRLIINNSIFKNNTALGIDTSANAGTSKAVDGNIGTTMLI